MIIETANFGKIEIAEDKVISFEEKILGFDEYSKYSIINNLDDDIFYWLQSIEDGNLSFIMINPLQFLDDYKITLTSRVQQKLNMKKDTDMVIYTIVVIDQATGDIRTNLKAPIIINAESNKGAQVVLDEDYPTRFYLFKADTAVEEKVRG